MQDVLTQRSLLPKYDSTKPLIENQIYLGADGMLYASALSRNIRADLISKVCFVYNMSDINAMFDRRDAHEKTVASCEGDRCIIK